MDRQAGLWVGRQPEVREVEMVEVSRRRRGRGRLLQVEGGYLALGRQEAGRHHAGDDQSDGEEKYETIAAPPVATARPWVAA
jgi:hypothetical protein